MNKISLTAIIPVFNEQSTVLDSVKRLLSVEEVDRIFIVDDGSTDNSPVILKKIELENDNVTLFTNKPNNGKGHAIKSVFQHLNTDYAVIHDSDLENWQQLSMTMNKEKAIEYVNSNKGFCYMTTFAGRIKLEALSVVCESSYSGWFNAFNLAYDPQPLLEANIEEFKTLIKKKNRYVITNQHPILLPGKLAINYEPYNDLGSKVLNERAKIVFKNKSLAEKFKHMEVDRQLEKIDESSQDNIFPESKANKFMEFGQQDVIKKFHDQKSWEEKYKTALSLRDPRAQFIAKRLIFDESPKTLSEEDFKMVHREMHDRLVVNQERPFTTIPEAMTQIDTEFSKLEDSDSETKQEKVEILNDYNKYLTFMEKYFSNKNSEPLPEGSKLSKHIFG